MEYALMILMVGSLHTKKSIVVCSLKGKDNVGGNWRKGEIKRERERLW